MSTIQHRNTVDAVTAGATDGATDGVSGSSANQHKQHRKRPQKSSRRLDLCIVLALTINAALVLYLTWGSRQPVDTKPSGVSAVVGDRNGDRIGRAAPMAQRRPAGGMHFSGELESLYEVTKAAADTHRHLVANGVAAASEAAPAAGASGGHVAGTPPAPAPLSPPRLGSPVALVQGTAKASPAASAGASPAASAADASGARRGGGLTPRHMLYASWPAWVAAGAPHGDLSAGAAVASSSDIGGGQVHHLPYFSILGAQKAGTTYLRWVLVQHPYLASGDGLHGEANGEPHFFDWGYPAVKKTDVAAVAAKYAAMFHGTAAKFHDGLVLDLAAASSPGSPGSPRSGNPGGGTALYFDTTPAYLVELDTVPERLHALLPKLKLVAIVRDPTDRYRSEFQMEVCRARYGTISDMYHQHGAMAQYLREPVAQKYKPLKRGLYLEQFRAWLKLWPREALLVLTSDELYAEPAAATDKVLAFLQVATPATFKGFNYKAPKNAACKKDMAPFLDAQELAQLRTFYAARNQGLAELLGVDFPWLAAS